MQRLQAAEEEMKQGNIQAIIARGAEFYGPYATKTSIPYFLAIENLMKGKKAKWLSNDNLLHSYSYTLDCAKGLYILASSSELLIRFGIFLLLIRV